MKLTVSQKKTTPISKDLIGVFFEDINYGADGGIYAELIENRNFEFVDCYGDKGDYYTIFDGGYGWKAYPAEDSARLQVVCGSPVSDENPHYLRCIQRFLLCKSSKLFRRDHCKGCKGWRNICRGQCAYGRGR